MAVTNIFLIGKHPGRDKLFGIFKEYTDSILLREPGVGVDGIKYYVEGRCLINKNAPWYKIINTFQEDLSSVDQHLVDDYIKFLNEYASFQERINARGERHGSDACGNLPTLIRNEIIPVLNHTYLYYRSSKRGGKSKKNRRNRRKKTRRNK